jgi:histidinol-phosphate aminotransferase
MRVMPPYSFSKPAEKSVLDALTNLGIKRAQENIEKTIQERQILKDNLLGLDYVSKVFPSETNFLLVRVSDAVKFCNIARESGFLLRDMSYHPTLENCVRITVGDQHQNQQLINGLKNG